MFDPENIFDESSLSPIDFSIGFTSDFEHFLTENTDASFENTKMIVEEAINGRSGHTSSPKRKRTPPRRSPSKGSAELAVERFSSPTPTIQKKPKKSSQKISSPSTKRPFINAILANNNDVTISSVPLPSIPTMFEDDSSSCLEEEETTTLDIDVVTTNTTTTRNVTAHNSNDSGLVVVSPPQKTKTVRAKKRSASPGDLAFASMVASAPERISRRKNVASKIDSSRYQIKVVEQPKPELVYKTIIKYPYPAVMLLDKQPDKPPDKNLYIEATLVKADDESPLITSLEGTQVIPVLPEEFAQFKKLKILSTSKQEGGVPFKLQFQLREYKTSCFLDVPNVRALSNTIDVFSHTQYLNKKKNSPPPPNVVGIIPSCGPCSGGTRTVLLGDNFMKGNNLRVKFGDIPVSVVYHEPRTLIVTTPPCVKPGMCKVRASNDGVEYCDNFVQFNYISPRESLSCINAK